MASHLQGISAPGCGRSGTAALSMRSYTSMSFAYLPKVREIPNYAFYECSALSLLTVDFSNMTSIGYAALMSCYLLSGPLSLPQCTYISDNAFAYCNITKVYAPLCSTRVYGTYVRCRSLSEAYLPNVPALTWSAFAYCTALRRVYLSACDYIHSTAFSGNTSLSSLYLAGSSVCEIASNLPLAYWPKSVYVLASMYDEYVTHSLWVSMSSRLVSLTTEQMEEIAATF